MPITEAQFARAAKDWIAKYWEPSSTAETQATRTKRFIYVAKNWFRFLGKWPDPDRNPQFKPELDSFLKELRDGRDYTDQTLPTPQSVLNLFFAGTRSVGKSRSS